MIRVIKLVSGEEIVGVTEDRETSLFIKWPVRLVPTFDEENEKPRIRVEMFASQIKGHSVDINKNNILFVGEPVPELRDYYDTNFGKMVPQAAANEA